jgi:hypothetical protein
MPFSEAKTKNHNMGKLMILIQNEWIFRTRIKGATFNKANVFNQETTMNETAKAIL